MYFNFCFYKFLTILISLMISIMIYLSEKNYFILAFKKKVTYNIMKIIVNQRNLFPFLCFILFKISFLCVNIIL